MHKHEETKTISSFVKELNNGLHVLAFLEQGQQYDFPSERN
jgi:hypothetical protein